MRFFAFFFCLVLFLLPFFREARGQKIAHDSAVSQTAYSNALRVYHQYLSPETRLYRGGQYVDYAYLIREGHPFFDSDRMQKGFVFYDGVLYQDVDVLYDIAKREVIINDPFKIYKISLIRQELDYFGIGDHLFINFKDTLNPTAPRSGYYEQLFKGNLLLYKRESKTVQEDLTSGEVRKFIIHTTSYFLKKGDNWYPVNNKGSLLHALGDRSREIRKFIRKNGLSMRKDQENTLIKAVTWYDAQTLNPAKTLNPVKQ